MSDWLFDLGNTRLKFAPLDARWQAGAPVALPNDVDDLRGALATALPDRIDTAYVASVAPAGLAGAVLDMLRERSRQVHVASTLASCAGLRVAYAQPQRLGVDRFLAMLAVHAAGEGPSLVCGVGTALTIDLVDAGGLHLGGRIAPSPALMREALHARATQLPESGGRYSEFADDTADALASGCEGAVIALVERSLAAAGRQLGAPPNLHLHGGGAQALLPHLPTARWSAQLVLDGLAAWARVQSQAQWQAQ